MSHFTVLVITDEPEFVEDQLDPFYEQVQEGDDYAEFSNEFTQEEAKVEKERVISEYKKKVETGDYITREQLLEKDKDNLFKKFHDNEGNLIKEPELIDEYGTKEHLLKQITKYEETSVKQFIEDYHGYSYDPEYEAYGYWHNPNSKWDWFEMGGRWSGFFKAKPSTEHKILGSPGVFKNVPKEGYVDQIQFKDIDIEGMKADDLEEANKLWDKLQEYLIEKKDFTEEQLKKELYWNFGDDAFEFRNDKEKFIASRCSEIPFQTFAVITKDGEWLEKGSMGWWGIVSDEDEESYKKSLSDVLKDVKPEDWLTVFDCHI